jgi:hypothetical protein
LIRYRQKIRTDRELNRRNTFRDNFLDGGLIDADQA